MNEEETISKAMSLLGSRTSPAKATASRENGKQPKKFTRTERERRRNVMIAMNKKRRKQTRAKLRAELNKN